MADLPTIPVATPGDKPTPTGAVTLDKDTYTKAELEALLKGRLPQEEVDKIVGERAARAKDTGRAELFAKYGVKDEDELAARIKELNDLKAAGQTETERLKAENVSATQAAAKATADAVTMKEEAQQMLIKAALVSEMGTKFLPEARDAVVLYVHNTPDLKAMLKVGDGNTVEGAKAVLDKVAETQKYFLASEIKDGKGPGTPSHTQPRKPAVPPDADKLRAEHEKTVRRM